MKVYAIILAGGQGTRLGTEIPKQFLPLEGRPVIRWSIDTFAGQAEVDHVIVVCPREHILFMEEHLKINPEPKVMAVIPGGTTRQGSAWQALTCNDFAPEDILLFHDAARPFVTVEIIGQCIRQAGTTGACGVYVPATDTITEIVDERVRAIPPREHLYYTQTPQAFRYDLIRQAHELAMQTGGNGATDDVSLVMRAGHEISAVMGIPENFKITTAFDYEMAKLIAARGSHGGTGNS